jgi:hypothetical protein
MTKTEQTLVDRVRATNDAGRVEHTPVGKTKGTYGGWRRGRTGCEPKKLETAALQRLVERGDLLRVRGGGYAIPGHEILSVVAAGVDLMRLARWVEEARVALEKATAGLEDAQAFVRENSK